MKNIFTQRTAITLIVGILFGIVGVFGFNALQSQYFQASIYELPPDAEGTITAEGFIEEAYLIAYPDIEKAIKEGVILSGLQHYEVQGKKEGRLQRREYQAVARALSNNFSEEAYLAAYPDVAAGIERGQWSSGLQHFAVGGDLEDRLNKEEYQNALSEIVIVFDEDAYKQAFPDVQDAIAHGVVGSAKEHYENFGIHEFRLSRPEYQQIIQEWSALASENIYAKLPQGYSKEDVGDIREYDGYWVANLEDRILVDLTDAPDFLDGYDVKYTGLIVYDIKRNGTHHIPWFFAQQWLNDRQGYGQPQGTFIDDGESVRQEFEHGTMTLPKRYVRFMAIGKIEKENIHISFFPESAQRIIVKNAPIDRLLNDVVLYYNTYMELSVPEGKAGPIMYFHETCGANTQTDDGRYYHEFVNEYNCYGDTITYAAGFSAGPYDTYINTFFGPYLLEDPERYYEVIEVFTHEMAHAFDAWNNVVFAIDDSRAEFRAELMKLLAIDMTGIPNRLGYAPHLYGVIEEGTYDELMISTNEWLEQAYIWFVDYYHDATRTYENWMASGSRISQFQDSVTGMIAHKIFVLDHVHARDDSVLPGVDSIKKLYKFYAENSERLLPYYDASFDNYEDGYSIEGWTAFLFEEMNRFVFAWSVLAGYDLSPSFMEHRTPICQATSDAITDVLSLPKSEREDAYFAKLSEGQIVSNCTRGRLPSNYTPELTVPKVVDYLVNSGFDVDRGVKFAQVGPEGDSISRNEIPDGWAACITQKLIEPEDSYYRKGVKIVKYEAVYEQLFERIRNRYFSHISYRHAFLKSPEDKGNCLYQYNDFETNIGDRYVASVKVRGGNQFDLDDAKLKLEVVHNPLSTTMRESSERYYTVIKNSNWMTIYSDPLTIRKDDVTETFEKLGVYFSIENPNAIVEFEDAELVNCADYPDFLACNAPIVLPFDEQKYLEAFVDLQIALRDGVITSLSDHYYGVGIKEKRLEDHRYKKAYLKDINWLDLPYVQTIFEHAFPDETYDPNGNQLQLPKYIKSFHTLLRDFVSIENLPFLEEVYSDAFADIKTAIENLILPNGYSHYNPYGLREGRLQDQRYIDAYIRRYM